jgi:hypothetical protein
VDGNFVFTNPAFVPTVGTSPQHVSFLPADSLNYSASGTLVSVVVNKAQPVVNVSPVASGIVYGQTLASSTLTAGEGSVPGTFAYSMPSSAPAAGLYSAAVTFTPSDAVSYLTAGTFVSVEVNKAVPLILEMPVAGSMSYGQPLGNSALVGGSASVSGAFEFTSPGNTPNAGVNSVGIRFTPADAGNYVMATGTISVLVNKALPAVSILPTPSAITYGQSLQQSVLSGGSASVDGVFSFVSPSFVPNAGMAAGWGNRTVLGGSRGRPTRSSCRRAGGYRYP